MNSNTVTPRCKVGDWALVIKPLFPENAGRVVRIVRPAAEDEREAAWLVRSEGGLLRDRCATGMVQETVMRDGRLLPIWWETKSDIETAALIGGIRDCSRLAKPAAAS